MEITSREDICVLVQSVLPYVSYDGKFVENSLLTVNEQALCSNERNAPGGLMGHYDLDL